MKPSREYYKWLRWCQLPLTIHIEPLRWTMGIAVRRYIDGSARHSHCYGAEIVLPVIRLATVISWGRPPISRSFSLADVHGFGDIGGDSWAKRHGLTNDDEDDD